MERRSRANHTETEKFNASKREPGIIDEVRVAVENQRVYLCTSSFLTDLLTLSLCRAA